MRIQLTSGNTIVPEAQKRESEIIRTTITSFEECLKMAESTVSVVAVENADDTTMTQPKSKDVSGVDLLKNTDTDVKVTLTTEEMKDTKYDEYFEKASQKYNVPVSLLKAMVKMESNFERYEVSSSGASGLMQLMPETAKYLGVTDVFDPEQNIMGGARYISEKIKAYDGDVQLALSAYNAGSGTVEKYGNTVPPQCKLYVSKILSYKEAYETAAAVG